MILNVALGSSNVSESALLNPQTPFAYLPEKYGSFTAFNEYTLVGSVAVLIWDILNTSIQDYELLSSQRISALTVVYLVSRISAVLFEVLSAIDLIIPVGNCERRGRILRSTFFVNRISTNTLFYARVRAVYMKRRFVLAFFGGLWLQSAAGASLVFVAVKAYQLNQKGYCSNRIVGPHWQIVVIPISESLFDLLVCLAVTYKIGSELSERDQPNSWRRWIFPSRTSRTRLADRLLRDNQVYFSLTIWVKVPEILIVTLSPVIPSLSPFQTILVYPDVVLTTTLVTRIYRNMKLRRKGLADFKTTARDPTFLGPNQDVLTPAV